MKYPFAFLLIASLPFCCAESSHGQKTQNNPEPGMCIDWISLWAVNSQGNPPSDSDGYYHGEWNKTLTGYMLDSSNGKVYLKGDIYVTPNATHNYNPIQFVTYGIKIQMQHKPFPFNGVYSDVGDPIIYDLSLADGRHDIFNPYDGGVFSFKDNQCNNFRKQSMIGKINLTVTAAGCGCNMLYEQKIAYYAGGFRSISVTANPSEITPGNYETEAITYSTNQWVENVNFTIKDTAFGTYYQQVADVFVPAEITREFEVTVLAEVEDGEPNMGSSYASTTYNVIQP